FVVETENQLMSQGGRYYILPVIYGKGGGLG
nr:RecName: Full=Proteinase inhibitor CeKI [Paubrasilia echinata]